jgi:hypothetical protein
MHILKRSYHPTLNFISKLISHRIKPFDQMNLNVGGGPESLNFNPDSQKVLLQMAANKKPDSSSNQGLGSDEETGGEGTKEIPIANFKSNKLSQIDRKQRAEEMEKLVKSGNDKISAQDAVRLPNAV